MKTITITRELTEEQIITLATEKGWSEYVPVEKEVEKEITETSLDENGEEIETTSTQTVIETVDELNTVTAEEFIGNFYLNRINKDAGEVFKELALKEIRLQQKELEDIEMEKVDALIGQGTKVEVL